MKAVPSFNPEPTATAPGRRRRWLRVKRFLPGPRLPPGATVVYCPRTHAAFGHPLHPVEDFLAAGVRVALCTDNPVVSDTRLSREYELAADLLDAASLDLIRQNASAARFANPGFRSPTHPPQALGTAGFPSP